MNVHPITYPPHSHCCPQCGGYPHRLIHKRLVACATCGTRYEKIERVKTTEEVLRSLKVVR